MIKEEIQRRRSKYQRQIEFKRKISLNYKPLFPELYTFRESFLNQGFLKMIENNEGPSSDSAKVLLRNRIFSFDVFTPEFCSKFMQEINHFKAQGLDYNKPNTMVKNGVILDEIGFGGFMDTFRENYLQRLCEIFFPKYIKPEDQLDSHRAFTIEYDPGSEQNSLGSHFDNAEITLNVSLDEDYTGGELIFTGSKFDEEPGPTTVIRHKKGRGVLHLGEEVHEAEETDSGRRTNLIIWLRSSRKRNEMCPMCGERPKITIVQDSHADGFTSERIEEKSMCSAS